MRHAIPTSAAGSEFDQFLYAPITEESNGMLLSMLSALARLDVDPWDEAERLARLPPESATRFLTALIAALPDGPSARADPEALAQRLVALLPQRLATRRHSPGPLPVTGLATSHHAFTSYLLLYVALMVLFLGAQWLMGRSQETGKSGTGCSRNSEQCIAAHCSTQYGGSSARSGVCRTLMAPLNAPVHADRADHMPIPIYRNRGTCRAAVLG